MHKVIQLISNFLYNKNMPLSMKVYVHYMNLMKNQIIQNLKSLNFEGKGCKENDFLKKLFDKTIVFNGFKMLSLKCKSHVEENILPKNMFSCPLKRNLEFLGIFGNFCIFG